jgi:hypothetical protein
MEVRRRQVDILILCRRHVIGQPNYERQLKTKNNEQCLTRVRITTNTTAITCHTDNYDAFVTPQEVLVIINQLNGRTFLDINGKLAATSLSDTIPAPFYDVNCDKFGTPQMAFSSSTNSTVAPSPPKEKHRPLPLRESRTR